MIITIVITTARDADAAAAESGHRGQDPALVDNVVITQ